MVHNESGILHAQAEDFHAASVASKVEVECTQSVDGVRTMLKKMYHLYQELGRGRRNPPEQIDEGDPEYWDTLVMSNYWRGYCDSQYFEGIKRELHDPNPTYYFKEYSESYDMFWRAYGDDVVGGYSEEIEFHPDLDFAELIDQGRLGCTVMYDPHREGLVCKIFEPTKVGDKLVQSLQKLSKKTAFHQPELFLYFLTGYPITCPRWVMKKKEEAIQGEFVIETFAENVSLNDFKGMYKQKNNMREEGRISFLLKKDLIIWRAMKRVQQEREVSPDTEGMLSGTQEKLWLKVLRECEKQGVDEWDKPATVKSRWWKMQDRLPGRVELDSENRLEFV